MHAPDVVILYVDQPPRSAAFYESLLGRPPVEASPGFAMFALHDGLMLGLWKRGDVAPAPAGGAGSTELAFTVGDPAAVDATHDAWHAKGLPIAQAPTAMDFGYTFVALDPDGHRLRVFAPASA
jgi:catechol 2,3-dioxygenase-like lactoylglutathione lyase family enzyme